MENFMVNIALPVGLIMAGLAAILFVVSMMAGILQNIKGSYKLLIALGAIILVFMVGYATASEENPTTIELSASTIRFISAGIVTMVTLVLVSIISIVGTAIYNVIK